MSDHESTLNCSDSLAASVDRLQSYEAIRQLAYRYAIAMDSRNIEALANLFVDDVQVGRNTFGREALSDNLSTQLRAIGRSILQVTNHAIDFVDADHATGIVYCRGEIEADGEWVVQTIQYRDRYERRNGQWLFVRRHHLLWYGVEVTRSPIDLPLANWPENHWGKGELPELDESWNAFWAGDSPS
jgi:ketosteroid isomerase-like protein